MKFEEAFARCPMVAILRGIRPDEAVAIGRALVAAGFTLIEVPLNSPDPFASIEKLVADLGDEAVVGGGTVLHPEEVAHLAEAGGRLLVAPNSNPDVIRAGAARGMATLPGYYTPTEAFTALAAGATALKLFPADVAGPAAMKAHRAVLPAGTRVLAVGGVTPEGLAPWRAVGAAGFGLGSALYKPGMGAKDVAATARAFVAALSETSRAPGAR